MVAASLALIPTLTAAPKPAPRARLAPNENGAAITPAATARPEATFAKVSTIESCFCEYLFNASTASSYEISPDSAFAIVSSIASEPFECPKKFLIPSHAFPTQPCSSLVCSKVSLSCATCSSVATVPPSDVLPPPSLCAPSPSCVPSSSCTPSSFVEFCCVSISSRVVS